MDNDILSYLNVDCCCSTNQVLVGSACKVFKTGEKNISQLCKAALEAHFICNTCMLLAKVIIIFDLLKINEDV